MQNFKEHENQSNETPPKDDNNLPVTELKDLKICDLSDRKNSKWLFKGNLMSYRKQKDNSKRSGK